MTSSRKRDSVGKKPTGESAGSVSPRRRRLIKGVAAAAPGIFTLYSGNAQAMLSTWQCTAQSQDAFSGEQEFAGEDHLVDGFVRLAEGPGIHVVWTKPPDPVGNGIGRRWEAGIWIGTGNGVGNGLENGIGNGLENGIGNGLENGIGNGLENGIGNGLQPETKDKWLIMVMDNAGVSHYIEAGYLTEDGGTKTSGVTWNDSLNGVEWLPAEDSGTGIFGSPLKLIDPSSDPSNPDIYVQDFNEVKTVQVLACIDDSGNVVSAYPQDCDALGFTPPSGSCWSSIGTESMNTWWG